MNKRVKREPTEIITPGLESVPKEVARVFEAMKENVQFKRVRYIAEIDYSIPSNKPRLFVYDRETKKLWKHKAAHGVGGKNASPHDGKCREVSNKPGSHMSCLGLFKTAETYNGSNGYSMRLDGLSPTNTNARPRAIVMHASDYVVDANSSICGRSYGCPAIDRAHHKETIDKLKGGSPILSHYNGAFKI